MIRQADMAAAIQNPLLRSLEKAALFAAKFILLGISKLFWLRLAAVNIRQPVGHRLVFGQPAFPHAREASSQFRTSCCQGGSIEFAPLEPTFDGAWDFEIAGLLRTGWSNSKD